MWTYNYYDPFELQHGFISNVISKLKGTIKKQHKYIERIETKNPKRPYRYIYDKPKNKISKKSKVTQKPQTKINQKRVTKYFARVKTTNLESKYRYFYSKESFDRFMSKSLSGVSKAISLGKSVADRLLTGRTNCFPTLEEWRAKYNPNYDTERDPYDNSISTSKIIRNVIASGLLDVYKMYNGVYSYKKSLNGLINLRASLPNETLGDKFQRLGNIDETLPGYHPESYDDLKRLDTDMDNDLDMEYVNIHNLGPEAYRNDGYTYNCAYCSVAYDMRQRGYDVEASAIYYGTANYTDKIASWYVDGQYSERYSNIKADKLADNILKDSGDGSRGFVSIYWVDGGGHSVIYEVVDDVVYIRDCQTNESWPLEDYPSYEYMDSIAYMRTDNLEPTDKALVGVKNRRDG